MKIPIRIRPLFWLLALFIGWLATFSLMGTILAVVVIFYSVLIHEFGHALTAMAFQQKVRIELAAFGGFTYREGRKLKLWEEFLVVLNGPLAGLLLAIVAYLIYKNFEVTNSSILFMLKFTALANFFWTVTNLIPLLPLDGGHLLSIVLEAIFGFKGIKMAILIGLIIGVSLTIFFFVIGAFLIGALFFILTFESFRSFKYYRLMNEKDQDENYQTLLKNAEADMAEGHVEKALEKFDTIRKQTKQGVLYTMATQEMARIYKHMENYKEAYSLLKPIKKSLDNDMQLMLQFLAYKNGDYKLAADIGEDCYQNKPSADVALINAYSFAALKNSEAATGWLECAEREGISSLKEVLAHKEFDAIRHSPKFEEFIKNRPLA